jgi:uncharacterized protein YggE
MLIAVAAVLAGAGASGLGDAQADSSDSTTSSTPPATIVVNGSDTITIAPGSDSAAQQSAYMTALGDAISNARVKATAIATQIGATLGPVENVTENSDSGGGLCQGVFEPLAANARTPSASSGVSSSSAKKKKHEKAGPLRPASTAAVLRGGPAVIVTDPPNCSIEADVTLTYDMTAS